jgi:two-component system, cell cycle response regulator DivK
VANELILVVEDNPKNLKLVRDVLQVKGYRTIEAGTGEEGVQLARDQHPALVLMDVQLPGISGVERQKVKAAGFDGFQGKPIRVRELLETVARDPR